MLLSRVYSNCFLLCEVTGLTSLNLLPMDLGDHILECNYNLRSNAVVILRAILITILIYA